MEPVKIKDNVYWVGGVDWNLRNFHGYLTQQGSTYNAYLIIDEKITLIDTVKHYLYDEMLDRISKIVDPAKIDYIIANHVEMDHSGGLPKIMEVAKNATIITSPNGEKGLKAHYRKDWDFKIIKSGEELNLGSKNLVFELTPMVHWPDNMVSYLKEDKILFSNDAFGQHLASSERFDDELEYGNVMYEAKKYYANIVMPFGAQVQKALVAVGSLDIDIIAPSHGVLIRSYIPQIVEAYQKWSKNEAQNKAVIVYDTMWASTEKIAASVMAACEEANIHAQLYNLQYNHISDIMVDILDAKYICVGSPTLNNSILPTVGAFLTYLKGLAPKNRIGLAFGSFGWSGQSVGIVEDALKECGFDMLEQIKIKYIPSPEELENSQNYIKQAFE